MSCSWDPPKHIQVTYYILPSVAVSSFITVLRIPPRHHVPVTTSLSLICCPHLPLPISGYPHRPPMCSGLSKPFPMPGIRFPLTFRGWRNGSVVKNVFCFCGRPEFSSQNSYQVAHNCSVGACTHVCVSTTKYKANLFFFK